MCGRGGRGSRGVGAGGMQGGEGWGVPQQTQEVISRNDDSANGII